MNSFDVILHPTDFSEDSSQAFQLACNMARDHFALLVIVHVLPADCCPADENEVGGEAEEGSVIQKCWQEFARMRSLAADIPVSFRLVFGNAVGSILNVAHEEKAELIVIASHRHSQFHLQVHGSVAEGVLRQTHCPVVVLRQPNQPFRRHTEPAISAEIA